MLDGKRACMKNDDEINEYEQRIKVLEEQVLQLIQENERLEQSEQMFQALFDQAGGYSLILDPNTPDGIPLILDANKAACEHHGYLRADFIGKPVDLIDDEAGKQRVIENTKKIMSGNPFHTENRHMRKDGTYFFVSVNAQRIVFKNRSPLILSTEYDITERIEMQNALQESERRFRMAILNLPFPAMIHAEDGEILLINNVWLKLSGYDYEEIDSLEKWTNRAYGFDHEAYLDFLNRVYAKEQRILDEEFTITKKDGNKLFWVFSTALAGDLPDGRRFIISTAIDITEQKKADQEIAELSRFPSENPNPVLRFDENGEIIYTNSSGEVLLENLLETDKQVCAQEFYQKISEVIETQQMQICEITVGDTWYLLNFAPVPGELYMNIYGTDISDTKKLQKEFIHSEKMNAIGQLAGGIAHDFNNMLGVIIGYNEMTMLKTDKDHITYPYLIEIMKAADHSSALTKQLLAFARKQPIAPSNLDLNLIVQKFYKMFERLIGEQISLEIDPTDEYLQVFIDEAQFIQILTNLCVNARDAIGKDLSGLVIIKTQKVSINEEYGSRFPEGSAGEYALLSVSDTGCGMDETTKKRMFEPFFTTKDTHKGTGMGFSTVYGIVKQNKGYIYVYSEIGVGTTINIYLPISEIGHPEKNRKKRRIPKKKQFKTIMIVEDEPALLLLNKTILEDLGYTVIESIAPSEALTLAADFTGEIDLLLTDVIMPGMNGKELKHKILDIYPHITYIYMSGYTADIIENQGILEDKIHFIQKPFSRFDLAAKIFEVLGKG